MVAKKTAKNFRGLLYFAEPCRIKHEVARTTLSEFLYHMLLMMKICHLNCVNCTLSTVKTARSQTCWRHLSQQLVVWIRQRWSVHDDLCRLSTVLPAYPCDQHRQCSRVSDARRQSLDPDTRLRGNNVNKQYHCPYYTIEHKYNMCSTQSLWVVRL